MSALLPIICLRFFEAFAEASALKYGLQCAGIHAFLCAAEEKRCGMTEEISSSIVRAPFVIVLGKSTHGKRASELSTYKELQLVVERQRPIFLVKLCENFDEPLAQFTLPLTIAQFTWLQDPENSVNVPAGLVQQIQSKLASLCLESTGTSTMAPWVGVVDENPSTLKAEAKLPLAVLNCEKKSLAEAVNEVTRAHRNSDCETVVQLVNEYGKTNKMVARKGCLAIWYFALNEANLVKLGDSGACEMLVEVLRAWGKKDKAVAEKGCESIGHLASSTYNIVKLGNAGACEEVVDALRVWGKIDLGVALSACFAISVLAIDEANKIKLKSLSAVGVVKMSMNNENQECALAKLGF
jgi:hypothetical protein